MSIELTKLVADFDTQLASSASIGATTATLVSATDDDGVALPTGQYGLTIDAGSSSKEYIICTLTSTALTNIYSISRQGVATSGFAKTHRRGAKVTLTDWTAIKGIQNVLEVGYASAHTPSTDYELATKKYVDDAAIAGGTNASTTTQGFVQLATQAQVDAGTSTGSTGAKLVATPDLIRAKAYHDYAADSVGTDAYAITITPAITAYATGQVFTFKAGTANTGACTLNVSGLGAKTIKKNVSSDLATGDILQNQIVTVVYDGTNMQLQSLPSGVISNSTTPVVQIFSGSSTSKGDSTTQFDITNPAGTTFRYTWDTTGTDPNISAATMPVGTPVAIVSSNFNNNNNVLTTVTGSGTNYFEVTNATGVAENNKTLGSGGYLKILNSQTYTKTPGIAYATIEVQGAGGAGNGTTSGGGAGGYSKKIIAASSLGTTETLYVGVGEVNAARIVGGFFSKFGSIITANGGTSAGLGGTSTGGDINIQGGDGSQSASNTTNIGGAGGDSFLGHGGGGVSHSAAGAGGTNGDNATGYGGGGGAFAPGSSGSPTNGIGADGIIIVTEYYS